MATQFFAKSLGRERAVNAYRIKKYKANSRYSVVETTDPSDWDEAYISFIRAAQQLDEAREAAYKNEN